jgi:hypothetical protein
MADRHRLSFGSSGIVRTQKTNPALGRARSKRKQRANSYPAEDEIVGRRAREVIPAAMRALERQHGLRGADWIIRLVGDSRQDRRA